MSKKVTIVLPIYNVEKYLNRCIKSILNQTYSNLEVILVDDGSPDGCPRLCDEWSKKDKRIKVVHKKNAGLGMARNTGIDTATGDFICFFDSDDFIESHTIQEAIEVVEKTKAEIVSFGYYDYSDGAIIETHIPCENILLYSGDKIIDEFLPEALKRKKLNFNMSAWTSMYSMQLIKDNKWKFASERDIISEDVFSLLELYRYVDSIAVMPKAYYYYCNNEVSLTRVFREDRFSLIGKFYIESVSLIEKNKYPVSVKRAMAYPYLANIIGAMKLLNESNLLTEEKRYQMKLLLNDAVFKLALSDIDLRYESFSRRILIFMMKLKLASGCLFLLAMKK